MDTTVTGIGAAVIAQLRAAGYMESTIVQKLKAIKALEQFVGQHGGRYTPALGRRFAALTISPRTGRFSRERRAEFGRLARLFDSYLATGQVDLSTRKRGGGGVRPATRGFIGLSDAWDADTAERGLAPATQSAYGRVARAYLVFLESRGIEALDDADAASVLEFLQWLVAGKWATSSLFWLTSNFRPFLAFAGRPDLVDAVRMAGVRRSHAIVPTLSDEAVSSILRTCAAGAVTARDAAITLLALTTGLRACDIVELRLTDVAWRTKTISIVQQKTHNPITIPMTDLLADRLASYLLDERPVAAGGHVFLRSVAPHTRLGDHASIYRITAQVFHTAGVTDVKAGTRLLRHSAASRLLRAATPLPTISAVLGHASPDSTNGYMSVDQERMMACVLPVPEGARP